MSNDGAHVIGWPSAGMARRGPAPVAFRRGPPGYFPRDGYTARLRPACVGGARVRRLVPPANE
jgi:hypothetical protein